MDTIPQAECRTLSPAAADKQTHECRRGAGLVRAPVQTIDSPGHETKKFAFIDALRGYAVLLVITCHTGGMFNELPYPLKKLTNFGWHGVQLFFLLSCVTLLMSWYSDETKGGANSLSFWIRRAFRIVPMYYLGAVIYAFLEPPPSGFDVNQLLASLFFVNAWYPTTIPTTPDRWMVVPGGWSVGVEFTFYLVFPLIATQVRSIRGAMLFAVISVAIGSLANVLVSGPLTETYGKTAAENFLYFWFPNQLPVFALGTIVYFILVGLWNRPNEAMSLIIKRNGLTIVGMCVGTGVVVANLPFPGRLPFALPLILPTVLVSSLIFMVVILVLGTAPNNLLVNRPICSLGRVSFSAYIIHFAVLHKLPVALPGVFDITSTGWRAIFVCMLLWAVAVPTTYGLSLITFRSIENPMISVGRRIMANLRSPVSVAS
jgi:peptidoglycan/LPS O-acetylase OafA/YrhL